MLYEITCYYLHSQSQFLSRISCAQNLQIANSIQLNKDLILPQLTSDNQSQIDWHSLSSASPNLPHLSWVAFEAHPVQFPQSSWLLFLHPHDLIQVGIIS